MIFKHGTIGLNTQILNGRNEHPIRTKMIMLEIDRFSSCTTKTGRVGWFVLGRNYENDYQKGKYWPAWADDHSDNGLFMVEERPSLESYLRSLI